MREISAGDAVTQVPLLRDAIHLVLDRDANGRLIGLDVFAASGSLPEELLDGAPEP